MQMVVGKISKPAAFSIWYGNVRVPPPSFFSIKLFQSARHGKQSVITGDVKYLFPEIQQSKFNFTIARVAPRISLCKTSIVILAKYTLCTHFISTDIYISSPFFFFLSTSKWTNVWNQIELLLSEFTSCLPWMNRELRFLFLLSLGKNLIGFLKSVPRVIRLIILMYNTNLNLKILVLRVGKGFLIFGLIIFNCAYYFLLRAIE